MIERAQRAQLRAKRTNLLLLWIFDFPLHLRGLYHSGPKVRLFPKPTLMAREHDLARAARAIAREAHKFASFVDF